LPIERWTLSVGRWALRRDTGVFLGKISIVDRLNFSPIDFFHISSVAGPFRAQRRKSLRNITVKIGIAPRAARVINAHGLVHLDFAVHRFGRRKGDLAEWNASVGMQLAGDINFLR